MMRHWCNCQGNVNSPNMYLFTKIAYDENFRKTINLLRVIIVCVENDCEANSLLLDEKTEIIVQISGACNHLGGMQHVRFYHC
jgi:hypothetical protein